jgi:gas vesicle protein
MSKEPLKVHVEVEDKLRVKGVDVANLREVDLKEVFDALVEAGQPIDDSTKSVLYLIQQIQQAGLSTVKFGETVKKVFKGDIEELTEEEGKLLSNMIQDYLGEMQGLFESIGEFAEKMGNDKLQGAMNGIAQSMEILGNVADRLAKGDWVGAIISGVTSLANVVMEALAAQLELNKAIAETRNEMRLLASENAIMQGVESAFGTDEYKKFTNAYDEVVKAHKQATEDIQKQNHKMWAGSKDNWGMAGVAGSAAGGAALGAAIGSIIPGIGTAVGAGIGALAGMIVGMVGGIATQANDYAKSLQEMADEIGADLINEKTGAFSSEALKSIKDTYKDLDSEYQEMLDKLITNAEIYENAITEMANYMTDVFGQCADDMADAFIESFKESGEAALDYGDIVSNVATSIAKSVLKSAIIQNVWDDAKAQEAAERLASGDMAGAMQTIENAMIAAQDLAPNFQSLLESLQPYFDMGSEASSDLTSGIKGITEDTANLLASYLNAIRADVAYSKTLWVRMDANLQRIADIFASSPSLMEYQAQIAANTYNTSIATERILAEIRSVVTTDGGDSAIRIHS